MAVVQSAAAPAASGTSGDSGDSSRGGSDRGGSSGTGSAVGSGSTDGNNGTATAGPSGGDGNGRSILPIAVGAAAGGCVLLLAVLAIVAVRHRRKFVSLHGQSGVHAKVEHTRPVGADAG